MKRQPSLQTLPWIIVRRITHHIDNERIFRQCIAIQTESLDKATLFTPLLSLGNTWSDLVNRILCKELRVYIASKDRKKQYFYRHNPNSNVKEKSFSLVCVKNVTMIVGLEDICNGFALECLLDMTANNLCFPNAENLFIRMNDDDCYVSTIEKVMENIPKFVVAIKKLFPSIQRFQNEAYCWEDSRYKENHLFLNSMLCKLKAIGADMTLCIYGDIPLGLASYTLIGLSSLTCTWKNGFNSASQLIRQNASTLVDLTVVVAEDEIDMFSLIFPPSKDKLVVYPHLRCIRAETVFMYRSKRMRKFPHGIPFPALKSISLMIPYPFGDDILVRDNLRNLECLEIAPENATLSMLTGCAGLSGELLNNVQHFRVANNRYLGTPREPMSMTMFSNIVRAVGKSVRTMEFTKLNAASTINSIVADDSAMFARLQVLVLENDLLNFSAILKLIQQLPQLTDLHSMFGGISAAYKDMPLDELVKHMHSTYYPLNNNFKCWKILSNWHRSLKPLAYSAVVLSILCPQFIDALVHRVDRVAYNDSINEAIASVSSLEIKHHLERLHFLDQG